MRTHGHCVCSTHEPMVRTCWVLITLCVVLLQFTCVSSSAVRIKDIVLPRPTTSTWVSNSVRFPGNFGPYLNPPIAAWDSAHETVTGSDANQDGVYELVLDSLPVGNFKFSVSLNENVVGRNFNNETEISFVIHNTNQSITLYFDIYTSFAFTSNSAIPVVKGTFMEQAGYGSNMNTSNLNGWMQQVSTSTPEKFQTRLFVPQGFWKYEIGYVQVSDVVVRHENTPFLFSISVSESAGRNITFAFDSLSHLVYDSSNHFFPSWHYKVNQQFDPTRPTWDIADPRPSTRATDLVVSFPGNYTSLLDNSQSNNDPAAIVVQASDSDRDGIYNLGITGLPKGIYSFHVALDKNDSKSFGKYSVHHGEPITFEIHSEESYVTLLYDRHHNFAASTDRRIPVLISDFMSTAGYGSNWNPNNLQGWLKDFAGEGQFSTSLWIPQGTWQFKIGMYKDSTEGFSLGISGTWFPYTIQIRNVAGEQVTFVYNSKTKSVTTSIVGHIPTPGSAAVTRYDDSASAQFKRGPRPHSVGSAIVSFPGNYAEKLSPPGAMWHPGEELVKGSDPDGDGIYTLDVILPRGDYAFKVALNEGWSLNYGQGSQRSGPDLPLIVKADYEPLTLFYDHIHRYVASSLDLMPILVGNFMSVAGYGTDWDPTNLNGWMKAAMSDDIYSTSLLVPKGIWEYKIAKYNTKLEEFSVGFAGTLASFSFQVLQVESQVSFVYDANTKLVVCSLDGAMNPPGHPLLTYQDPNRPGFSLGNPRPVVPSASGSDLQVAFPGDYPALLDPPSANWHPNISSVQGSDLDGDGVYTLGVVLRPGTYLYKAALFGSWSVNYGKGAEADGLNVELIVQEENSDVILYYDRAHNFVASSMDTMPIVIGDFMSVAGYGADWDATNLNAWMKPFATDGVYSTTLSVPAGTWNYMVCLYNNIENRFGFGGPIVNTRRPIQFTLDSAQSVTFVWNLNDQTVGDSITGFASLSCNVRCMNGGKCAESSCTCASTFTGSRCEIRSFYSKSCLATLPAAKFAHDHCGFNCQPGYQGRECTLQDFSIDTENCEIGWYGPGCRFQVGITGGSSMMLDLAQARKPWSNPTNKISRISSFPHWLVGNLIKQPGEWSSFWNCKTTINNEPADPFRHMHTIESWVYLPKGSGAFYSGTYIGIFQYCNFQYGIYYDGSGNFKLHVLLGKLEVLSLILSTATGRFMTEGPAPWFNGSPNTWYHLALVLEYEGVAGDSIHFTFYVNGEVQYSSASTMSSRTGANVAGSTFCHRPHDEVYFGRRMLDGNTDLEVQWAKLRFDEFRVYTTVRTANEIRDSMYRRVLEHELEKRNANLMKGMPDLFLYFPMNEFDRRDPSVGQPGTQWASITNQAYIVGKKEENVMDGVSPGTKVYLGLETRAMADIMQDGITAPHDIASDAPVVGWPKEVLGMQDLPIDFHLTAQLFERKLDYNTCTSTYNECLKAQSDQAENSRRRGGEDLSYPPLVSYHELQEPNQIKARIDGVEYIGDRSGSLTFVSTGSQVNIGDEYLLSEMHLQFNPAPNQYSETAAPLGTKVSLGRFAVIRYTVIDLRNITETEDLNPSIPGEVIVRIRKATQPVVGSPTRALHCGGSEASDKFSWAVADISIDMGKDFSVELWFLGIQHNHALLGMEHDLGGTILNGGLGNTGDPLLRIDYFLNSPIFVSWHDVSNLQVGFGGKVYMPYKWFHLAIVSDSIQNKITIYLDGEVAAEYKYSHSRSSQQIRGLFVCDSVHSDPTTSTNSVPPSWEGYIDEVRVWNTKRTQIDIQNWMHQELDFSTVDRNQLIGYWNFDEESTEIARDVSGNQNDIVFGNCAAELFIQHGAGIEQEKVCRNGETSESHKPGAPTEHYQLVSKQYRPFTEFPTIESPIRSWEASKQVVLFDTLTVFLDGSVTDQLDCRTNNPSTGRRRECSFPDESVERMEVELTTLPNSVGVEVWVGGSKINSPGVILSGPGEVKLVATSPGIIGGNPFTSMSYRIHDRVTGHRSVEQLISISLKCAKGQFLDNTTKKCKQCTSGTFNQLESVKTTCCDLESRQMDCPICPESMNLIQTEHTPAGTATCFCDSSKKEYNPVATIEEAHDMTNLCHICSNSIDLLANVSSCDPATNARMIQYTSLVQGCQPFPDFFVDCEYVGSSTTTGVAMTLLLMVAGVINGGFAIWVLVNRNKEVVVHSQPPLMFLTALGAMVFNLSALTLIGPNSNFRCLSRVWSLNLSFTLMFSALFAKVWRVHKIFNNREIQRVVVSYRVITKMIAKVFFVEILNLTLWTVISPSVATEIPLGVQVTVRHNPDEFTQTICRSENDTFSTVAVVIKLMILLYGVNLSWETRHIDGRFAEAKYIAMAIFYMFTFGGICFVSATAVANTSRARVTFEVIGIALCTTVSMFLIFFPKITVQLGFWKGILETQSNKPATGSVRVTPNMSGTLTCS